MKTHVDDVDRRNHNKPDRRIKARAREEDAVKLAEAVLALFPLHVYEGDSSVCPACHAIYLALQIKEGAK